MANDTKRAPGTGRYERSIDQARHDAEMAELRAQGWTYPQIAEKFDVDKSTVVRAVQRAIADVPAEAVDELRRIEDQRLDLVIAEAVRVIQATHPLVSHGKRIRGVDDSGPRLTALRLLLSASAAKCRLHGLNAPIRHEVLTLDAIDAEIRALEADLARRAAASETAAAQGTPAAAD